MDEVTKRLNKMALDRQELEDKIVGSYETLQAVEDKIADLKRRQDLRLSDDMLPVKEKQPEKIETADELAAKNKARAKAQHESTTLITRELTEEEITVRPKLPKTETVEKTVEKASDK